MTSKVNSVSVYLAESRFLLRAQPAWITISEADINWCRILVKQQPAHLGSTEFAYTYWLEEYFLLCR